MKFWPYDTFVVSDPFARLRQQRVTRQANALRADDPYAALKPTNAPLPVARTTEPSRGSLRDLLYNAAIALTGLRDATRPSAASAEPAPSFVRTLGAGASVSSIVLGATAPGASSTLVATHRVSEQLSTGAWSSNALGLDDAGVESPSTLTGTAALNTRSSAIRESTASLDLDTASAEQASTLTATSKVNTTTNTARSSSEALGLDLTSVESASTITSTAEMNTSTSTVATSSEALGLDATTAEQTSTLTSSADGSFDVNGVTITVDRDSDTLGSVLAKVNASGAGVTASYDPATDKVVFTPNAPGATLVLDNDTSGFLTAAKIALGAHGSAVNPDSPFDGSGPSDPLFDSGLSVTAGAFVVNGVTIDVAANDTLRTVLAKVNASAAGVTASLSDDKVTFAASGNSTSDIVFGADTSGFLAAVKLSDATTTRGSVHDDVQTFAQFAPSAALASVTTGSFSVNGSSISVDRDTDTLASVVAKINAAGAGVTASYTGDGLVFTPDVSGATLVLSDDASGFLAATKVALGATGTAVDPDAHFDGVGSGEPLFDPELHVTAGSFTVNGRTIDVAADDTLAGVLAKINASGAGVVATFADGQVSLRSDAASEQDITLGGDTSGFLAATKLSGATTVRGNVHDDVEVFARSSALGSIGTGSFSVNGKQIAVDRDTDTLQSVLSKINAADADVVASYDAGTGKLSFSPTTAGAPLMLGDDTSGFLDAMKISPGAQGTVADPDRPFDGIGANAPLLDDAVTAGSFTVNGAIIDVAANDTVNGVLAKINASSAGVVATLSNGTITLTTTDNSDAEIALGSDSSGFLRAAKLDGATTTRGYVTEVHQNLSRSAHFGSVTNGTLSINGTSISVNPDIDTVQSLLDRVNASGASVTASYDATSDKVLFMSTGSGTQLTLDDTSGFLAAAGIATGPREMEIDPNLAFDQVGPDTPLFDAGLSVQTGSFTVNGVTIDVAAHDTINGVLAKINSSDAGVVASVDATTQTMRLATTAATSTPITLEDDTSGFLAAVKLDATAVSTPGRAASPPIDQALGTTFSQLSSGVITVNGRAVAVDPRADTRRTVMNAIGSIPGVATSIDETTGQVSIRATAAGGALDLGDTTGLLSRLGIPTGVTSGTVSITQVLATGTDAPSPTSVREPVADIASAVARLREALSDPSADEARSLKADALSVIQSAVSRLQTPSGGAFALDGQNGMTVDETRLTDALRTGGSAITGMLRDGLAKELMAAVSTFDATIDSRKNRPQGPSSGEAASPIATALSLPRSEAFKVKLQEMQYRTLIESPKPAFVSADDGQDKPFRTPQAKKAYGLQTSAPRTKSRDRAPGD